MSEAVRSKFIRLGGVFGDAFGNPVVEVSGPFLEDFTSLPWTIADHRDGETAKYRAAGYSLWVQDCDGDYSVYEVRRGVVLIAGGSTPEFFEALAKAEEAMRAEVRSRLAALRPAPRQQAAPMLDGPRP